ncbi:MAG: bifunctional adenosylcobinamide kinase/adenosylcobinamide-phosphate guanylyltransferase [Oleiphilaceae bacterium]|nr:bifunctional adenosylcobinamide kinase/adenosylcobinamide-phosphate guanylyltransferase [Oleiphilaceae bacterium]
MKTLVLGGVKSGKSRFAEALAAQSDASVCYIATAQALDEAMAQRIARHQAQRPAHWQVIECPIDLPEALVALSGAGKTVLVDCLTLWLTNLLCRPEGAASLQPNVEALVRAVADFDGSLILVSNETNMGVMPVNELARRYCDEVGVLHQQLAACCEAVTLVLAGLPLMLKGEQP